MKIPMIAMAVVATLMGSSAAADTARIHLNGEFAGQPALAVVIQESRRNVFEGACGFVGANCPKGFVQSEGSDDRSIAGTDDDPSTARESAFVGAGVRIAGSDAGASRAILDDSEGDEGGAWQVSGLQAFDMATSRVWEAIFGTSQKEGSIREVADMPSSGRSCGIPQAAGDADFFEENVDILGHFVGENLLPLLPDTGEGENSVGKLPIKAGACAMRIDP